MEPKEDWVSDNATKVTIVAVVDEKVIYVYKGANHFESSMDRHMFERYFRKA